MKSNEPNSFQRRYESVLRRIKVLSSLRRIIELPVEYDIAERQWSLIESQLSVIESRLAARLKNAGRRYLPYIHNPHAARSMNLLLGELELDLSKALTFFDTFLDILTQRRVPQLGKLLAGCDIIAWHAIKKDHPALSIVEPPLVFCDRGFGASILREGIPLPDGTLNPMPLIQIPYSRLQSKSPNNIEELFILWTSEIGPDFWTFCNVGMAQTSSIKEILSLPPNKVFNLSWIDPHPPPFIRVIMSIDWCRQIWGRGPWDRWEKEWKELYPLDFAPPEVTKVLTQAIRYLPHVSRALFKTKFYALNWRTIPSLFALSEIAPWKLEKIVMSASSGKLNLEGLSPSAQLSLLRLIRDKEKFSEMSIDKLMTDWLLNLAEQRKRKSYALARPLILK